MRGGAILRTHLWRNLYLRQDTACKQRYDFRRSHWYRVHTTISPHAST